MPVPAPSDRAAEAATFVQHAGGEPHLPRQTPDSPFVEIGTLAGVTVWLADDGIAAAQAARRCVRSGALGLVCARTLHRDAWQLAATILPIRATVIGHGDEHRLQRLRRAAASASGPALARVIALAEALDIDAAGRRTFATLNALLDRGIGALPAAVARDDRHAWVMTQLTRLLFLRFVESEGWLAANPRFLGEAADRCLAARRDPLPHFLHPLFFGTLNRPTTQRSRLARSFGAVPFLNGGLFEPASVERHALRPPLEWWQEVFDALTARVDVTLDHAAESDRVTPEMLGRAFEGLMHPEERRQQGTFFTPPALVHAVLRSALVVHMAARLCRAEDAVDRALDDPDPELRLALLDVTVLDPAAGSGAFLVGALDLLHGPGPRDPRRVRRIVTRRLFGVDLHPGAVRIAELRLWLEVLRSLRGRPAAAIPPLPNLDAAIRAGDALIDPLFGTPPGSMAARRLRVAQRRLRQSHGSAKRAAIRHLRAMERRIVLRTMADRDQLLVQQLEELHAAADAPTLFGDRTGLTDSARKAAEEIVASRRQLRRDAARIRRDAAAPPFALAAAFAPLLMRRGGFDLVVGNPPWVRAERLSPELRSALTARYRWWRSAGADGWAHLPDLAVAFLERSHSLLAPQGTLACIVPSKIATARYATAARAGLIRGTLHHVVDLSGDPRAGFDAVTYPLALIASREAAPQHHVVRRQLGTGATAHPQALWRDAAQWSLASSPLQALAARLAHDFSPASALVTAHLGVKTGANALFLNPPPGVERWCRLAIRGRDIVPLRAAGSTRLLWLADARGTPWTAIPDAAMTLLEPSITSLNRRADSQGQPWQLFRTRVATAPHRVVWRDLAQRMTAAVPDDDAVPLNSCYVASLPTRKSAHALAAWLNGSAIAAIARSIAEPAAGGCARFNARVFAALPLPPSVLEDDALADLGAAPWSAEVHARIDRRAAQLLQLTTREEDDCQPLATHRG